MPTYPIKCPVPPSPPRSFDCSFALENRLEKRKILRRRHRGTCCHMDMIDKSRIGFYFDFLFVDWISSGLGGFIFEFAHLFSSLLVSWVRSVG